MLEVLGFRPEQHCYSLLMQCWVAKRDLGKMYETLEIVEREGLLCSKHYEKIMHFHFLSDRDRRKAAEAILRLAERLHKKKVNASIHCCAYYVFAKGVIDGSG